MKISGKWSHAVHNAQLALLSSTILPSTPINNSPPLILKNENISSFSYLISKTRNAKPSSQKSGKHQQSHSAVCMISIQPTNLYSFGDSKDFVYSPVEERDIIFHSSDPEFEYDLLDMIKIFGRIAEEDDFEGSSNIIYSPSMFSYNNDKLSLDTLDLSNKPNLSHKKVLNNSSTCNPKWKFLFYKKASLNETEFSEILHSLPFKWPESTRFPFYYVYLYEHGYMRDQDYPKLREAVNNKIQEETISEIAIRNVFKILSDNSNTITQYSILSCFHEWISSLNLAIETPQPQKRSFWSKILAFTTKSSNQEEKIEPTYYIDWKSFLSIVNRQFYT